MMVHHYKVEQEMEGSSRRSSTIPALFRKWKEAAAVQDTIPVLFRKWKEAAAVQDTIPALFRKFCRKLRRPYSKDSRSPSHLADCRINYYPKGKEKFRRK
jgi:hypothetical protein